MLYSTLTPAEKRRRLRARLDDTDELLRLPGAFNPLSARLIEQKGFEGVYVSGPSSAPTSGCPTSASRP